MKKHRIFIENIKNFESISAAEIKHLRVRRAKIGDQVTMIDGNGQELITIITEANDFSFQFSIGKIINNDYELPQEVTVAFSLIKNDESMIIRACTELGASIFQPIIAERCQIRNVNQSKLERWQKIAIEAAKQCGRSVIPEVRPPIELKEIPQTKCGLVAVPISQTPPIVDWQNPICLLTGPEGGFSKKEIKFVTERNFHSVNLGKRILRAETAPLVLLTAIGAALGL